MGSEGLILLQDRQVNGQAMRILYGPKCVQGVFWWKVAEPFDGTVPPPEVITGWVPKTIQPQYVLEPLE